MGNAIQGKDIQQQPLTSHWAESIWFRALLITLLLLGIYFRFAGLGNKIYSHDEVYTSLYAAGYLGGEAFTALWDENTKTPEDLKVFLQPREDKNIAQILSPMALYRPHQAPIYFLLTHYWMQVFGSTPAAMRALAAFFGCLAIPAMYWLGRELFQSSRPAYLAAGLFAISPFHILFAQDARPYSLWTLITIVSSAVLLRAIRKRDLIPWMIYSVTLIVGVYSHQLFILVAIVHACYFVGVQILKSRKDHNGFLFASLFAVLIYTPWLYFVVMRWRQAATQLDVLSMQVPWYRFIQRWILLFSSPLIDLDFNSNVLNLLPYFLRTGLLIFCAYAFVFLMRRASYREKLFLGLIYMIAAGSFIVLDLLFGGMRSITGRYCVPANLATILVLAYFLTANLDQARPKTQTKWRLFITLLVVSSILSNVNSLWADTWWNKELGRVRTEFVREINRDGVLLLVSGQHPTNLGDVLLLGFALDHDVLFRLYRDPADINIAGNHQNLYLFPSTYADVQKINTKEQFEAREVLPGILWRIEFNEN